MVAVTLAAQLATLPITLLYFHQFPTYFLIANLIAVPLSTAILFTEIGIVLFGFFTPLASLFGTLTHWGISFMNGMAETIEQWPNSSIKYIPASVESTLFFYAIIVFLFTWLINKKKRHFFVLLLMICCFSVVHALETFATWNQKKFIVFHQYKKTAMVWISGRKSLWLISPELMQDKRWGNQVETGVYNQFRIKKTNSTWTYVTENHDKYVEVNHKKYLILSGGKTSYKAIKNIDCLIMTNHAKLNLSNLAHQTKIEQVVIAPTNSKWKIERWKKEAEALPLRCFSITDQGAYME
jgi:competence protein ComEC